MTKTDQHTGRTIERELTINASPEAVWEAIATGEGVARWFGFEARVDGVVGGDYFVSWGSECEGTWKIESWEPPHRLVTLDENFVPGMPQTVEFLIEGSAGQRGRTTLRLIHSGVGADTKWDEMYDSMSRGWDVMMCTLRHSVDRHPGVNRTIARATRSIPMDRTAVWERLMGPDGFDLKRDADTFQLGTLDGKMWIWNPPKDLAGTIPALNDAAMWIALEGGAEKSNLDMTLSAYGADEAKVRELEASWIATLGRLFE